MTTHLVPSGPFCHVLEIGTPGQVQRHSDFEWLCKQNRLRPEPIRFVRLDSGHAQSDGRSVNRGLPVFDLARGRLEAHSGQTQKSNALSGFRRLELRKSLKRKPARLL